MKKIKLFFALFAMLALGVTNAWAETATLTFSAKCGGKGTDTQGYNWTITSDGTESNFDNTKGIHYGTNSAKVQYIRLSTSDIPGTITEVKVNASTASSVTANLTVKVGSSDFTTGNSVTSQTLSTSATEYTFSGSASGEIIVEISKASSATKAIYCKSVVVTYETSGSTEPAASLTANPTSLDFDNVTQNNEVEAKTFTISGSDFTTGELTITAPSGYTVNPTTVPVNGTLEETTITVTPNTSTVGTFDGNVTISGANLKSSVNVALSMTVEKAPATPTENVYVKVTSTAGITDGEYLIVYETGNVAFNGALETLDVASNTVEVTISDNVITGNTDIDKALFTIDATNGTVLSASGKYIGGKSSDDNGINISATALANDLSIDQDGNAIIASNSKAIRYNSASGQYRFRYYKSGQQPIALYKKASSHTVTIASCINGSVSADVASGATVLSGTTITLNNTPATGYKLAAYDVYKTGEESTKVTVTDGKFIMPEFDVTISATFELAKTLTGIEITTHATQTTFWQGETFNYEGLKVTAHFDGAANEDVTDKVTVTGSTDAAGTQTVEVSFTEGEITEDATYTITVNAIPNTKETAYTVADAFDIIDKLTTAEGVFISGIISQVDSYNSTYQSITYWISDDGTTTKQLQAYSGKGLEGADFVDINGVSVEDQVIVCGNLKKHTDGTYEFNYNNYLVEHIKTTKADPELSYTTTEYNVNLGEAFTAPTLNNPHSLAITYSSNDEDVATVAVDGAVTIKAAGTVTITASFAGDEDYVAGEASYTINITDPSISKATFVAGTDKSEELSISKNGVTVEFTGGTFNRDDNYRCYVGQSMTISYADGNITKIVIECTANDGAEYGPGQFTTETATYSYSGKVGTWTGEANSVTFTNIKQVRMTAITVYYKQDTRTPAGIAWTPATVSLTQGDAFAAPTFSNPNSLEVSFESSNDEVATVTAEGEIALASAIGTATITATFAGDLTYKPAIATCTITVNEYIETIDGEWQLVTDASKLQAGMEIIIASVADAGAVKTMGEQGNNNRSAVASTVDGDELNPAVGTTVITLEDCQLYEGLFALKTKDGYLYAASSSSNHLRSQEGIDEDACWTITITEGVAAVVATNSSNHNIMRYNDNNDLFSCYVSGQQDIAIYAKKPAHTRTTSAGRYGTICLPGNIVKCLGATLYEVAGKDGNKVIFDEVLTPEAGMPYIFLTHNAEVLFFCGDQTAAEGNHNSLYGTFSVLQDAQLDGMYIVQNNKIVKCAATGCGVAEYRAYFNGTELESLGSAPAPMPGRRRITMGTESENTATGTEEVVAPAGQTLKLIENGQLIIIRDGEKYNAQGVRL